MSLKLIGGKFKNHTIKSPVGILTKPTMSLMRKSVFDICQNHISETRFLDVFACSGAMGIEALSRGASFSTFIDIDKRACRCIKENLQSLQLEDQGKVLCADALSALKELNQKGEKFDLVYVDPPYTHIAKNGFSPKEFIEFFDTSKLLNPDAILFIEEAFPSSFSIEELSLTSLNFKNSRKFSSSLLHQFYIS